MLSVNKLKLKLIIFCLKSFKIITMKSFSIVSSMIKRQICNHRCFYTSIPGYSTECANNRKRIETLFINQEVQRILKKITGLDYQKVFAVSKKPLKPHKYEFATKERLQELQNIARSKAEKKLQMPPVMDVRKPINEVLSVDPELQGYLMYRTIFTDISTSVSNRERVITVREVDGTLRKATWEERERMNQIFFPIAGKSLETPTLFEHSRLQNLLDQNEYKFVLDCACVQFEPDSTEYHEVTSETYEHIRQFKKFDLLRSTRHFGPMAFYFALKKNIDDLLLDMIKNSLIGDASDTVKLLYILHPELKISNDVETNEVTTIQDYIKHHSTSKGDLELALQTSLEQQQLNLEKEASA